MTNVQRSKLIRSAKVEQETFRKQERIIITYT